jgi:predicted amidohydrolase
MRIAALQSEIVWEDPPANFVRLEPWIRMAAAAQAGFLILPETFACGFSMQTQRVSEPPDGPSCEFLCRQAQAHQLWLAGSVPERVSAGEQPYNTLILAGPGGQIHRYRKIHPFTHAGEDQHYAAGDPFTTVTIGDLRFTFFICYDLRFADEFWVNAPHTDVYVVVANWPEARRHHWTALLLARAIENQAYVVGVNRVGSGGGLRYRGDSRVIDPMGEILVAAADQETLLLADLDPQHVVKTRQEFPFLRDRR